MSELLENLGRIQRLLGHKLLYSGLLVFGVLSLSFVLFSVAPGDPARVMLGSNASEQQVQALRRELGLDRPLLEQFGRYLSNIAKFDLGVSFANGRKVTTEVREKFAITATIGLQATGISLVVSYALNLIFFLWPRTASILPIVRFGVLLPVFLITILGALAIGTVVPNISAAGGSDAVGPGQQIFPSIVAALYPIAVMTTVLRDKIQQTMDSPFFRAARAAGYYGWELFHYGVFRPVSVSWVAIGINQLSLVFFASLVLEVILSIPGSGNLLLNAIQWRDYPVLQGILLVNAGFFIGVTWLGDLLYSVLDPRT